MDISDFAGARREGAYVADMEVGERILRVLRQATCPTFIFAITMENHGPLHLEPARLEDTKGFYSCPPPVGCDDLSTYLYHLSNADAMLRMLQSALQSACPASLCFYGDHVPIMPSAYKVLEAPTGIVPYLCWSSQCTHVVPRSETAWKAAVGAGSMERPLAVHDLALTWLASLSVLEQ